MPQVANNVQCVLSAVAPADASITISNPAAPLRLPATPTTYGIATLLDLLYNPTLVEVVHYTGLTNNGNGTHTLTGVTRGQEGTTAQAFATGFLIQAPTAGLMDAKANSADLGTAAQANTADLVQTSGNQTITGTKTFNGVINGTAVTQSATDTTAGRLLKVGDFGVGVMRGVTGATFTGDINNLTTSGLYQMIPTLTNAPPNLSEIGFDCLVTASSSGITRTTQLAFRSQGAETLQYVRSYNGTSWTPWRELYHTGNIVTGVTPQFPGGGSAIIERGTGNGGEYVRFADGTQICTRVIGLGGSLTLPTTRTDYAYPASFPIAPFVSGMAFVATSSASIIAGIQVGFSGFGTTSGANWPGVVVDDLKGSYTAQSVTLYLAAIGRWF